MAIVIDDIFLPATLSAKPMTDKEFGKLCADHPDLSFEMTAEGELIVMAPTALLSSIRNSHICGQLDLWAKTDGRGFAFESTAGFVLPNGARRSPDASWAPKTRLETLDPNDEDSFSHFCPDFVIELRSASDRLPKLKAKMHEYLANGAQLGWLIDPKSRSVTIFRPATEPETQTDLSSISGEGPVAGFILDLDFIWNPLGR
jgi:Uma2 family endonuclease